MVPQPKRLAATHRGNVQIYRRNIQKEVTLDKQTEQFQFLGLSKLNDRSYSPFSKGVWFAIVVVCCSSCFFQITSRIGIYLDRCTTLEVMLTPQTSFFFPSITLCNMNLVYLMWELEKNKNDVVGNEKFNFSDASTDTLWNTMGKIQLEDLLVHVLCINETTNGCTRPVTDLMRTDYVNTIFGSCVMLTMKDKMDYRGPHTIVTLYLTTDETFYKPQAAKEFSFFLYGDSLKHQYDGMIIAEEAQIGCSTKFRIYEKEYNNLNMYPNPCSSAEETVKCLTNCVEKLLLKNLTCRFPFVNSTLPNCTSIEDIVEDYWLAWDIISSIAKNTKLCRCKRKCNEIKYRINKDTERESDNANTTKLRLLFADETHETLTEREMFTMSALFSDIGGTMGVYLGLSIFTIFDLVTFLIRRSLSKIKPEV